MGKANAASVLIVDDQQEGSGLANILQPKRIAVKILHPEEVTIEDVASADLVLVDYQLEQWPERAGTPASRSPRDGLALAAVLRRHVHDREKESPTAIAILTGKIEQLAAPLQPEHREHVLARMINLEWVFQKNKPHLEDQVAELAAAVPRLPKQWPLADGEEAMRKLAELLAFDPDDPQTAQQREDVAACIPPIHELSQWSHGLAILRWLLHRILPYPCFLWDSHYVAARMRVDHGWLCEMLAKNSALRKWLESAQYKGFLSSFSGPRWWRARLELLLWEKTDQQSFDIERIWDALKKITRQDVKPSEPADHPIVCVNSDYQPLEKFEAMEEAVRIRPDDWPSYADQPWTTIELATAEPRLRALVVAEDRGRLDGNGE